MGASLWQRLGCCLTGHDYSVRSDDTRMFLRCTSCGHTSRGLVLAAAPYNKRSHTEPGSPAGGRQGAARASLAAR